MPTQTLTPTDFLFNFVFIHPSPHPLSIQPLQACSRDYGFDFDEDELAKELLAPLPASLGNETAHHVEPDEFNMLYRWFDA